MKRRKNIIATLTIAALFITSAPVAFADDSYESVTSYEQLAAEFEEAEKGEVAASAILYDDVGEKYKVDMYQYDQDVDGDEIAVTYIASVDSDHIHSIKDSSAKSGDGSKTESKWDSSSSVKGTVTIVYKKRKSAKWSDDEYLLTKVSGTWTAQSGITLSNRRIVYACGADNSVLKTTNSGSFSYNTGFTTYVRNIAGMSLGCNSFVTIKHGTSSKTWTLQTTNTLFGNFPDI